MPAEIEIRTVLKSRLVNLLREIDTLDLRLVGAQLLTSGCMALIAKNIPFAIIRSQLAGVYEQLNLAKTFLDGMLEKE